MGLSPDSHVERRRLSLRLLGPFECLVDGESVRLAPGPRALLVALALRRGDTASMDSLIDSVWETGGPASARSIVQVYVSQLRRVLPADRLVTVQGGYRLVVEADELDVSSFELLMADARHSVSEGQVRLAASIYSSALELWRGEALTDLRRESFARDEAARLDDLRLTCLEEQIEVELRLGHHAELVTELERLVAEHPLRERLRGKLMIALYRSGRQADALACYRAGRDLLVSELGLEPSAELRDLERRILDHDPVVAPPEQSSSSRSRVPVPQTPTIGRDAELDEVTVLLRNPRIRLVTLIGPGGIGKTRLAVELASSLGDALADGAALVDLASLDEGAQLLPAIGHALGLREGDSSGWGALIAKHLQELEFLLVLDNLEHLVEGTDVLTTLLDAAPRLTILATSRRRLRLSAEQAFEVRPLDTESACDLLARRALAAGAAVDPTSHAPDRRLRAPRRHAARDRACRPVVPDAFRHGAPRSPRLPARRHSDTGRATRRAGNRRCARRSTGASTLLDPTAQHLLGRLSLFRRPLHRRGGARASAPRRRRSTRSTELVETSIVQSLERRLRPARGRPRVCAGAAVRRPRRARLHAAYFLELAERAEPELVGARAGRMARSARGRATTISALRSTGSPSNARRRTNCVSQPLSDASGTSAAT